MILKKKEAGIRWQQKQDRSRYYTEQEEAEKWKRSGTDRYIWIFIQVSI